MYVFSSQSEIKPLLKIRRERSLPLAGEIIVRLGQEITPVQVVARMSQQRGFYVVPAADLLDVPAEEIEKYLLVEEGAAVLEGTPLLRKDSLFGNKVFSAPADGVLYAVSHGRLILQQTPDLLELRSMLYGHVHSFVSNRGVIIETAGSLIQAAWCSGHEGYGKLLIMVNRREELLRNNYIGASSRGAVLVAGRLDQLDVLNRAAENSARGIIVGSVRAALVPDIKEVGLPVFVTNGFGEQPMTEPIFQFLQEMEGRDVCLLNNAQFGRPGRPEIIVPLSAGKDAPVPVPTTQQLAVGQKVRVRRAPYAGEVGEVTAVYSRSQTLDVGIRTPGVDVKLGDGQTVYIPYLNLDFIG